MKNLKQLSVIHLVNRINEIRVERQQLDIEYNQIVKELWDRIPSLQTDENLQPKAIQKTIGGLNDGKKDNSSN